MRDVIKKTCLFIFILIGLGYAGVTEAAPAEIAIYVNGEELQEASKLAKVKDQSIYVPVRSIAEKLGAQVDWLPDQNAVAITNEDQNVLLWHGKNQAYVNGAMVELEQSPFAEAGRTYVPIRFMSESLGMNVDWVQATRTVMIASQYTMVAEQPVIEISAEDKKWLAQIIEAEAGGEPLEGKIAVGAVIINRVQSALFPNTVTDVVFEKANGYFQFSPVANQTIYKVKPSVETMEAVRRALLGEDPSEGSLYFYNPKKSNSNWITTRKVVKDIGSHRFAY